MRHTASGLAQPFNQELEQPPGLNPSGDSGPRAAVGLEAPCGLEVPNALHPALCPEFQQERVGAEPTDSRAAEAVQAALWPSRRGQVGSCVSGKPVRWDSWAPGHLRTLDAHTTEPLEDDRWMD